MRTMKTPNSQQVKTFEEVFTKAVKSDQFKAVYANEVFLRGLASEIRNVRLRKRLTQEDLAQKANLSLSAIARIESGNHTLSLATLDRIAHALGRKVKLA